MLLDRIIALLLSACLALAPLAASASQNQLSSPTTGTVSGLQLTNNYNNALDSLNTCNSGATAPVNQLTGSPSAGNCWLDTSVTPYRMKLYDGAQWVIAAILDPSNHYWVPVTGGGAVQSIASATTTDLCSSNANYPTYVSITNAVTITGFGSNCEVGQVKIGVFASSPAPLLTNNATSLILPTGGSNYQALQGDIFAAVYLGSGNWRVIFIMPASGAAVSPTANFVGAISINGAIAPSALAASQNNWAPAGIAAANQVRITTSANASINITGISAPAVNGQRLTLFNDNAAGSAACSAGVNCSIVLTANDASSSAANRFCLARPYGLHPQKSLTLVYGGTGAGFTSSCWRLEVSYEAQPPAAVFKNAKLTNGGTPNNQLVYTADEITLEDVNGVAVRLTSVSCTADITSSGAGGLDTGSVTQNQGYYFWVIFAPSTNTTNCLFSTASALGSITFPNSYSHAARVGWDFVENAVGKRLNRILCFGRRCQYVMTTSSATPNLPLTSLSQSQTNTSINLATQIPATASILNGEVGYNSSGTSCGIALAPNANYGQAWNNANTAPAPVSVFAPGSGTPAGNLNFSMVLETAQTVYYSTNSNCSYSLGVVGWEDNL